MRRIFFKLFAIVLLAGIPLSAHADTVPTCCCRADPPECQTLHPDPFATTDYDQFCKDNTFDTAVGAPYKTCEEMVADESYLATKTDTAQPTGPLPTPGPAVGPKATPINALGPTGVAADPLCWSKDACQVAVDTAGGKWDGSNWIPDKRCQKGGIEWGKCTATPQVTAQITIGKKTFSDLGDYIQTIYNYLIGIAGIVATVLIMAAGFDWILAAGSAEAISHAKTKIVNATMGLILVIGSYLLLNTINPDLVKLRLPQVYLLRRITAGAQLCKDQGALVAYKGGPYENIPEGAFTIDPKRAITDPNESVNKMAACGFYFYPKDGAGAECLGTQCAPKKEENKITPQVCAQLSTISAPTKYKCVSGSLSGTIRGAEGNWEYPWVMPAELNQAAQSGSPEQSLFPTVAVGGLHLLGACNDGSVEYTRIAVLETPDSPQEQTYLFNWEGNFKELDELENKCKGGNHGGLKGFAFIAFMNDNETLGFDEWRVLGKSGDGQCNKQLLGGNKSLSGLTYVPLGNAEQAIKSAPLSDLITLNEIKEGIVCDITVTDSTFGK